MRRRVATRHDALVITHAALRPTGALSPAARRPSVVPTLLRVLAAPVVGLVADATSLRVALGVVPLLALTVVVLAGVLRAATVRRG